MVEPAIIALSILCVVGQAGFPIEAEANPATYRPIWPRDGSVAVMNPPRIVWQHESRAASYTLELSRSPDFGEPIRVEGIALALYNHSETLDEGTWHWRYRAVTAEGEASAWSPTRRFVIDDSSIPFPVPTIDRLMAELPPHPRVYVNASTLEAFRARKDGEAKAAWEAIGHTIRRLEGSELPTPEPGEAPSAKQRGVAFFLRGDGALPAKGISPGTLENESVGTEIAALAYVVTGDRSYAELAKRRALWQANFRLDWHQEERAHHDTVHVYEYGLKRIAVTYDYLYDVLTQTEREAILAHIAYHGDNAFRKLRDVVRIHLRYQNSHACQDMHELVTTALAVAGDLPEARDWLEFVVPQYASILPWGLDDGGYSEGHYYNYKWHGMLQCAAALRSATSIDLLKTPRYANAGAFWLYCMSRNYWWSHYGDNFSMIRPITGNGNDKDGANFLAAVYGDRYVRWYADSLLDNYKQPLWYMSDETLRPKPPVDVPQGRAFRDVGWTAAYDRFYDEEGVRLFFKSSPWGGYSHSHQDQNSFVIHAFGEILAIDNGYYGYYGDKYHAEWTRQTAAHNSILADGRGQERGIEEDGHIRSFFESPAYNVVVGDASRAYGEPVTQFLRAMVFVRPGHIVVYDQLEASEPIRWTWLLQAFEPMEIDEAERTVTIRQRDVRLRARQLAPAGFAYSQGNERTDPLKMRYTEAFAQQWTMRAETREPAASERVVSVLQPYREEDGAAVDGEELVEFADWIGVRARVGDVTETTLFRRDMSESGSASAEGITSDAAVVSVGRGSDGSVRRLLMLEGTALALDGQPVVEADARCSVACMHDTGAAAAQIDVTGAGRLSTWLPKRPRRTVLTGPPPERAGVPGTCEWSAEEGMLRVESEAQEFTVWVDPVRAPNRRAKAVPLGVRDSKGEYRVATEAARADDGDDVHFVRLSVREPGMYDIDAGRDAEIYVHDRYDNELDVRGSGKAVATLRDKAALIVRCAPRRAVRRLRARLVESFDGRVINLVRNGGFEVGVPLYPPRYWWVRHYRTGDPSFPEWSDERPAAGERCLRLHRIRTTIRTYSDVFEVDRPGTYVLQFKARATSPGGYVGVRGAGPSSCSARIEQSEEWREYRTEAHFERGTYFVHCSFDEAKSEDEAVCVDEVSFGAAPT
ncbi:MAG: DUF4962 domain-containing protein [Armatimonadota bacterium]|jgi:hypothetical protein